MKTIIITENQLDRLMSKLIEEEILNIEEEKKKLLIEKIISADTNKLRELPSNAVLEKTSTDGRIEIYKVDSLPGYFVLKNKITIAFHNSLAEAEEEFNCIIEEEK
jgi:CHAT domain-containing protein